MNEGLGSISKQLYPQTLQGSAPTHEIEAKEREHEIKYEIKQKREFYEALIHFQSDFDGLVCDKEMQISQYTKFKYVSHTQLIKLISKTLANCNLGHISTQTLDNNMLTVETRVFHKNGYGESSVMHFDIPVDIFVSGVKEACMHKDFKDKIRYSSMKFMHELAKAAGLASKYSLQGLLGIAGGEVEETPKSSEMSEDEYNKTYISLQEWGVKKNVVTKKEMLNFVKTLKGHPREKILELRNYLAAHKKKKEEAILPKFKSENGIDGVQNVVNSK